MKTLLTASVISGLITVSAFQQSYIVSYEKVLNAKNLQIKEQTAIIDEQAAEIEQLTNTNTMLSLELENVRDSLQIAHNELAFAQKQLAKSKKSLSAVQQELSVRKKELDLLKQELKALKKRKKSKHSAREIALKQQVEVLQSQVEQLKYLQQKDEQRVEQNQEQVAEKNSYAEEIQRLAYILDKTAVEYRAVSLREVRDGDDIHKLKKNGRNWKYTVVNLDLQNAIPGILTGSEFELRIVDMDTGEPLSYLESNLVYPDAKDDKGLRFTYPGHAQELTFINTEPKEGSNYELQLFFIDNSGQSYLVNRSHKAIVFDKMILQ